MAVARTVVRQRVEHVPTGGPVRSASIGRTLRSIREGQSASLAKFARQLGISRSNLSDVELGRRGISVERAASWAKLLGYPEGQFVELALQAQINDAGLHLTVTVIAQSPPRALGRRGREQ